MNSKELYNKLIDEKITNLINEYEKNLVYMKLFKKDNREINKRISNLRKEKKC